MDRRRPWLLTFVGASVWERALYQHLSAHAETEAGLLAAYQQAAAETDSPAFRYLVAMIVDDEVRHHRLFAELAESLRAEAELLAATPPVPRLGPWRQNRAEAVDITERLLAQERADARELSRLARQLREVKDTTLWHLVVEVMEMDTKKHIAVLEFLRRHG